MKAKSFVMGVVLLLAALAISIPAVDATPPNKSKFSWTQDYDGWGPALYYGEPVRVQYEAVNTWHVEIRDNSDGTWYVNQELTQDGTAYIYALDDGELLDVKRFRVTEITHGTVSELKSWYYILDFDYVDQWNYHWIIPGVYHFVAYGRDFPIEEIWDNIVYECWVRGVGWTQIWPPS